MVRDNNTIISETFSKNLRTDAVLTRLSCIFLECISVCKCGNLLWVVATIQQ